ncbi:Glyoxylase, beta-lactamase superfamily II [Devosia lucknowensis]|uniref:Glyoxylase, beta-lactamase superfamily II n=1 Tax=Devosia lucknowensis TaxID=1096929 RepID=A0A1Y6G6G9_9HYPH|nr:MBL fold metallo-hydrolase [Devosia lucknowensis]SMQ85686.1 Glyoxylase, beta-lactamase superfamily II [Devosia lucknowensis]
MTDPRLEHWAEDIVCLRLPMPAFGGVTAFLLGEPGRQAILDTGAPGAETAAIWLSLLDGRSNAVESIVCSHAHIDHVGQAGMLVRHTGAPLLMSRVEHEDIARLSTMDRQQRQASATTFYDQCAIPVDKRAPPIDYSSLAPFPRPAAHLHDGETVELGGIAFEVWIGGGHSRAPVCLLSRERKVFLAADQLLMGSGPQVPVQAERPDDDMLGDYFRFLDRLDTLPDDLVVFPGHGDPVREFKRQVAAIREAHRQRLTRLLEGMQGEMTCADMAPLLFANPSPRLISRMPYLLRPMANYLVAEGQLQARLDGAVLKYRTL